MEIKAMDAESAVVGAILLDARCLPVAASILTADDFALEANRAIYKAAIDLERNGQVVDPVTIRERVGKAVSQDYLLNLMDVTPTAANIEEYAKATRKWSMRRSLSALAERVTERATVGEDPRAVIGDAQRELERIEAQDTAKELSTPGEAILSFYEHRSRVDSGTGGFVTTGFERLDTLLGGGMVNGGLYVMAARPGMGKTSLALVLADHIAAEGPTLFVSLEMDTEQIVAKRLSRESGIAYDRLMIGKLDDEEQSKMSLASIELEKLPLSINRKPWATVDDIGNLARRVKGLRCIVVDYFGLIRSTDHRTKRYEAMTEISGHLKTMARSLKVPILCLAQLNRENMNRQGNRPQLSDLRDTGALEQDADGVIFLHRPDYYEKKEEADRHPWEPVTMQIILEKNRHGQTGICDAVCYLATGRIIPARRVTTSKNKCQAKNRQG